MRPDDIPDWATDGGSRLKPGAGAIATGWLANQRPPPRWMNWIQGILCDWVRSLSAYRIIDFAWSGSHSNTNAFPMDLTDVGGALGTLDNDGTYDYIELPPGKYDIEIRYKGRINQATTLGYTLWRGNLNPAIGENMGSGSTTVASNVDGGFVRSILVEPETAQIYYLRLTSGDNGTADISGQIKITEA